MTELGWLTVLVICKALCVIAAISGAVFLAWHGKDGWGWLIVLAVILASGSLSYKNDDAEQKTEQVK